MGKVQKEIPEGDLQKRDEGSRRRGGFFGFGAASDRPPITETDCATRELGHFKQTADL